MSYIQSLSEAQKNNAKILTERMIANGITNQYTQAAILSVISKESELIPKSENLNYSEASIAKVFKNVPEKIIPQLARNPEALGNYVYGPSYNPSLGNSVNEGYKYRGRGYNQITGKANYKSIGSQLGVDLVSNPDLLNDPTVAANAAILFFKNGIKALASKGKLSAYNATNINDFKSVQDSVGAIYHINAGVGKSNEQLQADTTGGKAKAESRVGGIFDYIQSIAKSAASTAGQVASETVNKAKNNPIPTILITAGLAILSYYFFFQQTKK